MNNIYYHKWKALNYSISIKEAHNEYIICKIISHVVASKVNEIIMITNKDFNRFFDTKDNYDKLEELFSQ